MKKVKFKITMTGGYDKSLKLKTHHEERNGYVFEYRGVALAASKAGDGSWGISEYATGCGLTLRHKTRREAILMAKKILNNLGTTLQIMRDRDRFITERGMINA